MIVGCRQNCHLAGENRLHYEWRHGVRRFHRCQFLHVIAGKMTAVTVRPAFNDPDGAVDQVARLLRRGADLHEVRRRP